MYVLLHITVNYCCIHEEIIRRELLLCSFAGCFRGGATGPTSHLLHWLHHFHHLSLNHCSLLLSHGV